MAAFDKNSLHFDTHVFKLSLFIKHGDTVWSQSVECTCFFSKILVFWICQFIFVRLGLNISLSSVIYKKIMQWFMKRSTLINTIEFFMTRDTEKGL